MDYADREVSVKASRIFLSPHKDDSPPPSWFPITTQGTEASAAIEVRRNASESLVTLAINTGESFEECERFFSSM